MRIKRRTPFVPASNRAQTTLVVLLAALLGVLSQFQFFGYLAIAFYAILATWQGVSSRATFILVVIGLSVVPVAIIMGNTVTAVNFAAYTFLLMGVGVMQIFVELIHESRAILAEKAKGHNPTAYRGGATRE
jgi:hypothetical protein